MTTGEILKASESAVIDRRYNFGIGGIGIGGHRPPLQCRYKCSEVREQRAELALGILVMLLEGEEQRLFEPRFRLGGAAELEQEFSQENSRHHPVRFFLRAELVMWQRFLAATFRGERLCQAETEQLVLWLSLDECVKVFGAGRHF